MKGALCHLMESYYVAFQKIKNQISQDVCLKCWKTLKMFDVDFSFYWLNLVVSW